MVEIFLKISGIVRHFRFHYSTIKISQVSNRGNNIAGCELILKFSSVSDVEIVIISIVLAIFLNFYLPKTFNSVADLECLQCPPLQLMR